MSDHLATTHWQRDATAPTADFHAQRYSRQHRLYFDGGATVSASASPSNVLPRWADAAAVDPEELFVAALSSCHMLWFLSLAAAAGWCVDDYRDDAVGTLARNTNGDLAMTVVLLRPAVRFNGEHRPNAGQLQQLHHDAHRRCFIANSVTSELRIEPVAIEAGP
ncbi:MAG: OsmC family protein [Rubrivivax sp.]